jgi:hypothetical protein
MFAPLSPGLLLRLPHCGACRREAIVAHELQYRHVPRRPRGAVRTIARRLAVPPGVTQQVLRIPITNVFGGGDYTAAVLVGTEGQSANVILDTGSSTLAVTQDAYNPALDTTPPQPTTLAQVILYGTGGWAGPVLGTEVAVGGLAFAGAQIALAVDQEPNNFGAADGILGLAFNALNSASNTGKPTYPWPFTVKGTQAGLIAFEKELAKDATTDVDPYFSQLAGQGVVANKFAFYTLRSFPRVATANATSTALANDPYNQGFLILGGGDEPAQADLFSGSFANVLVVDDLYYNVNLKSVQVVGGGPAVAAAALQAQFVQDAGSNAIVDTGTNSLVLAADVFAAILDGLQAVNPTFAQLLQSTQPVPVSQLTLAAWPDIVLVLEGQAGDVALTITPQTYWQVDSPSPNVASPVVSGMSTQDPNQSILGLPLMNNYYTVFDRSTGNGIIRFAPIKLPA